MLPVVGDRRGFRGLFDDPESARAVRRHGEQLEPGTVERWLLAFRELEVERDRWMNPDTAAAIPDLGRLFPGEGETLIAAQFDDDNDLDVRKDPVVELDLESGVAVDEGSHRMHAFQARIMAATVRRP